MITVKELREKRNKLMHDAQALIMKDSVSAEDRANFDKMLIEVGNIEKDIQAAETLSAKIAADERGAVPPRGTPAGAGQENEAQSKEQRKSFSDYIRYGIRRQVTAEEARDLGTVTGGAITEGAQFIPQLFYPALISAKKAWGALIEAVNEKPSDTGAPMKVALDNDTGNLAHIIGEAAQVTENDPPLSGTMLETDTFVTDIVKVSIQELQDSYFDIDAFIRDKFGKRYFRGLTSAITNGTYLGSPQVAQNTQSILSAAYNGYTTAANNAIAYADVVGTWAALDPAYLEEAKWVMNNTTRGKLLSVTDSLGRPLYIPNPSTGAFDKLLGCDVVLNQYMPQFGAGNIPIQFGDFKQGYVLRTVKPGMAIMRLNERYADTLEVGFLGYFRAGGLGTDAGTHPIINMTVHA